MFLLRRFKIILYTVAFFPFFGNSLIKSAELTEVHKLLVSKDHLSNLKTPTKIKYIFRKTGSLEPGFNDRVVMIVPEKDDKGVHNIKFDLAWIYEAGFSYSGNIYDTMIGEYVLGRGKLTLVMVKKILL